MSIIKIKTPAKINIGLNVVEKREDGFHNIETLFYPLPCLYDEIIIQPAEQLSVLVEKFNLPLEENIVLKALKLLEQETSCKLRLSVTLVKNIPAGAGLGGGSSDAATILTAINKLLKLNLSPQKLNSLALELGSDVPFFLNPVPSLGYSRGEILTPVDFKIDFPILIINPGIHISTAKAFSKVKPSRPKVKIENLISPTKEINYEELRANIRNDFEEIIFSEFPQIKEIKEGLYESGALLALMSGTGSTVFGIFEEQKKAEKALRAFPANYFKVICS